MVHRAHLHDALHQLALQLGVDVKVNHRVVEYNEENPSVKVEDGTILSADLIIAADGNPFVHSSFCITSVLTLH